jgi:hypothetical protein
LHRAAILSLHLGARSSFHCGIGSCSVPRPSQGDYVAGMGPTDGPTAPPERASVGYPLVFAFLSRGLILLLFPWP